MLVIGDLVMPKPHKHSNSWANCFGLITDTRPSYNDTTEYRIVWTDQKTGHQFHSWSYGYGIQRLRAVKWWEK